MSLMTRFYRATRTTGVTGVVAAAVMLAPMGAMHTNAARSNAPVTITMWGWSPHTEDLTKLFEKYHPDIKVNFVNTGGGTGKEYTKLEVALKAGKGLPDAVMLEHYVLPQFAASGSLLDLSQYGAKSIAKDFVPAVWSQMIQGSKIYGTPLDYAPMAFAYRKDIFDKYHLSVPTTWAEYAQTAAALHKADPKMVLGNSPLDEGNFLGMLWQAKDQVFHVNGTTVSINLADATAQRVLAFWANLVQQHLVTTFPAFTPSWNSSFSGTVASWITPSWGLVFQQPAAASSSGKWRLAPLPTWTKGVPSSAMWGGSAYSVMAKSAHPKEAAEYVIWMNDDTRAAALQQELTHAFPVLKSFSIPKYLGAPSPFFGGQAINELYYKAATSVDTHWQWNPFMIYTNQEVLGAVIAAEKGKTGVNQTLTQLQNNLVSYAKNQGFTVK